MTLIIQPDGKLVVAGEAAWFPNSPAQFALVRYLQNGQLDAGFGEGGRVYARFTGSAGAFALALLADGRLLVCGNVSAVNAVPGGYAVMRFLPNGTVDTSFGVAGRTLARGPQLGSALAMWVQNDGKIIVGASVTPAGGTEGLALIGGTADGALDPSFGTGGVVLMTFPTGAILHALALQSDGKLLAGGQFGGNFALTRYLRSGALDPVFGSGGLVTTSFGFSGGASNQIDLLVIQPDAKIVGAGVSDFHGPIGGGGSLPAMARYLP